MSPELKKDLYCNYKWLKKFPRFSDTLVTEDKLDVKLVLLSRHQAFRKGLRTSRTKFKKINAEHLNIDKDFCLNLCKMRVNNYAANYHVMFINHKINAQHVLRYVNMLLMDIVHYYYPELSDDNDKNNHNKIMREIILTKWSLDLSNSLNDTYMKGYKDA